MLYVLHLNTLSPAQKAARLGSLLVASNHTQQDWVASRHLMCLE